MLADKREAPEILLGPPRLNFDHGAKCADRERIAGAVECDGDSPSVSMTVALVGTALVVKHEPITNESADDFASGEIELFPFDLAHTVIATSGSSETAAAAGTGLPSSTSSATSISSTSRMCLSASSRV